MKKSQNVISEDRLFVAMAMALKVHGHRKAANMGGIGLDVDIQGRDRAAQTLWADPQLVDLFQKLLFKSCDLRI